MKVRVNVSLRLVGDEPGRLFAGEELELPDPQARELISRGEAIEVIAEEAEAPEADATGDGGEPAAPQVRRRAKIAQAPATPGELR